MSRPMGETPTAHVPSAATDRSPAPLELSIVLPCLNEAETLATCITKAQGFLDRHGIAGEVVVGDNGSTDGSQEIAARHGARVVPVPTRGYGAALRGACRAALGRYLIMGDADDSYDFSDLMPIFVRLRAGDDLVMGNRFRGGIKPGAMPWKNRYVGNPVLSGLGRLFFGTPIQDFHCGLRGFSADAFGRMDLRTTGMEFASEMVIKASVAGMRVSEVPVTLAPDGRSRAPHLRPWRDGWRHLRFMLLYSPDWLFLIPGLILAASGLAAGAWLLPGPRRVLGVELDVHTLLYSGLAVLLGVQAVAFALFARVLAVLEGLRPADGVFRCLTRHARLEVGLTVGLLLALAGVGGSVAAVLGWSHGGFGHLDPRDVLREVIPSFLAIAIGGQVVLASFMMSVIQLKVRHDDEGSAPP
jgi:hypothetical protein